MSYPARAEGLVNMIIVNVFDETGYAWTPAHLHHLPFIPSLFFSKKLSPSIFTSLSLKLIHLNLIESLMKPDTSDVTRLPPSTKRVTIKTNNPYRHHLKPISTSIPFLPLSAACLKTLSLSLCLYFLFYFISLLNC